ncbi:MAG: AbrB/MazE/SpoVT family DNA-binding domain-containing protein [Firmicutes bacterium]|nr:AbrB/MazE/SpoVT family DNA-binding domain-containing protein [Bacillota bacterium]
MKATGIVRKVDDLGRVVLPIELRRSLGIQEKDPLEIFVEGDHIVLRKPSRLCIFCGSGESIEEFRGKGVCPTCRSALGDAR